MMDSKLILIFGILMICNTVFADQRHLIWTYEYLTLEPGTAEVENYFTSSIVDLDNREATTKSEHQIELEIGMTEQFDFAVYQTFSQFSGEALHYDGFKLRARYKFGERGSYVLNPLLYLEYKGKPDFEEHTWETKLILDKDFGNFRIALNPIVEFEQENDEWETEFEYAGGAYYSFSSLMHFGMEIKGSEYGNYVGPTLAHGTKHVWSAVGFLKNIDDVDSGKPEFMLRWILGIDL